MSVFYMAELLVVISFKRRRLNAAAENLHNKELIESKKFSHNICLSTLKSKQNIIVRYASVSSSTFAGYSHTIYCFIVCDGLDFKAMFIMHDRVSTRCTPSVLSATIYSWLQWPLYCSESSNRLFLRFCFLLKVKQKTNITKTICLQLLKDLKYFIFRTIPLKKP